MLSFRFGKLRTCDLRSLVKSYLNNHYYKVRVKTLKSEIEKAKEQSDKILSFMILIHKYSSFEDLTPEILRSFIDRVIVHEKTKVDGHYRQTVEIIYNFVGAIDKPLFGEEIN